MGEAVLLASGEGRPVDLGPAGSGTVKAGPDATDDTVGVWEFTLKPGGPPPPPHLHRRTHEFLYVLDGEAEVAVGERTALTSAGAFACLPPGTVHGIAASGQGPCRVLVVASPASLHQAVVDAFQRLLEGGPPDEQQLALVFAGADIEFPRPSGT